MNGLQVGISTYHLRSGHPDFIFYSNSIENEAKSGTSSDSDDDIQVFYYFEMYFSSIFVLKLFFKSQIVYDSTQNYQPMQIVPIRRLGLPSLGNLSKLGIFKILKKKKLFSFIFYRPIKHLSQTWEIYKSIRSHYYRVIRFFLYLKVILPVLRKFGDFCSTKVLFCSTKKMLQWMFLLLLSKNWTSCSTDFRTMLTTYWNSICVGLKIFKGKSYAWSSSSTNFSLVLDFSKNSNFPEKWPNEWVPSDHIPLVVEFELRKITGNEQNGSTAGSSNAKI